MICKKQEAGSKSMKAILIVKMELGKWECEVFRDEVTVINGSVCNDKEWEVNA